MYFWENPASSDVTTETKRRQNEGVDNRAHSDTDHNNI